MELDLETLLEQILHDAERKGSVPVESSWLMANETVLDKADLLRQTYPHIVNLREVCLWLKARFDAAIPTDRTVEGVNASGVNPIFQYHILRFLLEKDLPLNEKRPVWPRLNVMPSPASPRRKREDSYNPFDISKSVEDLFRDNVLALKNGFALELERLSPSQAGHKNERKSHKTGQEHHQHLPMTEVVLDTQTLDWVNAFIQLEIDFLRVKSSQTKNHSVLLSALNSRSVQQKGPPKKEKEGVIRLTAIEPHKPALAPLVLRPRSASDPATMPGVAAPEVMSLWGKESCSYLQGFSWVLIQNATGYTQEGIAIPAAGLSGGGGSASPEDQRHNKQALWSLRGPLGERIGTVFVYKSKVMKIEPTHPSYAQAMKPAVDELMALWYQEIKDNQKVAAAQPLADKKALEVRIEIAPEVEAAGYSWIPGVGVVSDQRVLTDREVTHLGDYFEKEWALNIGLPLKDARRQQWKVFLRQAVISTRYSVLERLLSPKERYWDKVKKTAATPWRWVGLGRVEEYLSPDKKILLEDKKNEALRWAVVVRSAFKANQVDLALMSWKQFEQLSENLKTQFEQLDKEPNYFTTEEQSDYKTKIKTISRVWVDALDSCIESGNSLLAAHLCIRYDAQKMGGDMLVAQKLRDHFKVVLQKPKDQAMSYVAAFLKHPLFINGPGHKAMHQGHLFASCIKSQKKEWISWALHRLNPSFDQGAYLIKTALTSHDQKTAEYLSKLYSDRVLQNVIEDAELPFTLRNKAFIKERVKHKILPWADKGELLSILIREKEHEQVDESIRKLRVKVKEHGPQNIEKAVLQLIKMKEDDWTQKTLASVCELHKAQHHDLAAPFLDALAVGHFKMAEVLRPYQKPFSKHSEKILSYWISNIKLKEPALVRQALSWALPLANPAVHGPYALQQASQSKKVLIKPLQEWLSEQGFKVGIGKDGVRVQVTQIKKQEGTVGSEERRPETLNKKERANDQKDKGHWRSAQSLQKESVAHKKQAIRQRIELSRIESGLRRVRRAS